MAYAPLALIVFILPIKKIIKQNKRYIPIVILTGIILIMTVIFTFLSKDIEDDDRGGNANTEGQIQYMINNPIATIKLGINHIRLTILNFNWLAQLNMSIFFCDVSSNIFLLMLIFIVLVSITDTSKNFKIKDEIIFIITFLIIFGISSLTLYIKFTPVGDETIKGYQPRYIFPILPLLLMTLSNGLINIKEKKNINMGIATIASIFLMLGVIGNIMVL